MQKYVIRSRNPTASMRIRAALVKGLRRFAPKKGQSLLQEAYEKQDSAAQRKAALDIRLEMLSNRLEARRDPKKKQKVEAAPETLPEVTASRPAEDIKAPSHAGLESEAEAPPVSAALPAQAGAGAIFLRATRVLR